MKIIKTKFINNAVHFVFSVEYEENSDYLSSLKSFRLEFTDKDGFTIVKKDVFVREMTVMINGNESEFSGKFDTNKETYLLIDDAYVVWIPWE